MAQEEAAVELSVIDDLEPPKQPRPRRTLVHFNSVDEESETDGKCNKEALESQDSTLNRPRLQRLKSKLSLEELANNELELKAALYFHICNPLKRWKIQRTIPTKLILNLVKAVLILIQVGLFVNMQASKRTHFLLSTENLLEKIFLQNYVSVYSLYTKEQLFEEINHAVEAYYLLPNIPVGGFGYTNDSSITCTIKEYKEVDLNPSTLNYRFDTTIEERVIKLHLNSTTNITEALMFENYILDRLIELKLSMMINNIHLADRGAVECFLFEVDITFSNQNHDGFIQYRLSLNYDKVQCNEAENSTADRTAFIVCGIIMDVLVMVLSAISICLVIPTYIRAYRLGKAMGEFYENQLKLALSWKERSSLFSKWLMLTVLSDLFLFMGSFIKILLQLDVITNTASARILLGSAVIMHSGTILRYASFFKQLNALTRTLNVAFPELIKSLICTSILFFAFTVCGYTVFGPYSEKFSNVSISLESLYSLTYGDDIYPSFRNFNISDSLAVYIYSRIFIYVFVALFVYAVLNLFTTLIISAYEDSQKIDRSLSNEVRRFVFSGPLTENGAALRDVTYVRKYVDPAKVLNKFYRQRKHSYMVDID